MDDVIPEQSIVMSLGQAQLQRLNCSLLHRSGYYQLKTEGNVPKDWSILSAESNKTHT